MTTQLQQYRFTDCRCIIESNWDILGLLIFSIFFFAGFFYIMKSFRDYINK